ncbi:MAG: TlpA family protein disulfide reductase [Bacteroidales bacterium]|nr:TlpA family protein disulfide reductase [Bacteroidales bacterium]
MKKYCILLSAVLLAASCNNPTARLDLTVGGIADESLALYKLDYNRFLLEDSLKCDKAGHISCKISLPNDSDPMFYYVYRGNTKLAGIVAEKGSRISVTADTLGQYEVSGSDDSSLLKEMEDRLARDKAQMSQIVEQDAPDAARQLTQVYIRHKRELLKQIYTNPYSITSAAALFEKFSPELPVFKEETDVVIFESIRDSLASRYPKSSYVQALTQEAATRRNIIDLNQKVSEVATAGIPVLKMKDINGQIVSTDSLSGKVFIISFWSVAQNEHKVFNQEIMPIYEKYHDRGFEIYQVSLDIDKTAWATVVRSQNIPWISVNDGLGIDSPSARLYNLNAVPTNFIIDRENNIVGKDIYDPAALENLIRKYI